MSMKIQLYDSPKLANEVKPGDIIEAMSNSRATIAGFRGSRILTSPTGTYGYIIGLAVKDPSGLVYTSADAGDTLVRKVYPRVESDTAFRTSTLNEWVDRSKTEIPDSGFYNGPALVVGQIVYDGSAANEDLTSHLAEGSILLPERKIIEVVSRISEFHNNRIKVDYVAVTPSGEEISLDDVNIEDQIKTAVSELSEEDLEGEVSDETLLEIAETEIDSFDTLNSKDLKLAIGEEVQEVEEEIILEDTSEDDITEVPLEKEKSTTKSVSSTDGAEALKNLLTALTNENVAASMKGMKISINITLGDN